MSASGRELAGGAATLAFLGGAGTVTGSRFLVETRRARVLVDCGLFQGLKALRERNWARFPVAPSSVDAVVLTHAHVDHCGYLPALARRGFAGSVHATEGTRRLCGIVLPDAGHLQEEEADYANRKGYSKHAPALPLFTEEDGREAAERIRALPLREEREVADGVHVRLRGAGHILGAASVELRVESGPSLVASGDLGRPRHPLLAPPEPPPAADALLVESTYGNRRHEDADVVERLGELVRRTAERGGMVLIPAFAVDRTEVILLHLKRMMEEGRVPRVPVYADSPMALAALEVYRDAIARGSPSVRPEWHGAKEPFDPGTLVEARDVQASKALHDVKGPAVLVSASGMATGGRVLHHLRHRLPDPRNSVALVGYQAAGTRGRRLLAGEPLLKLLGRYVPVKAEVADLTGFSVHADRDELLEWMSAAEGEPGITYVVHGEPEAASALRDAVATRLRRPAVVPEQGERVRL